jgi:hypothetical protein
MPIHTQSNPAWVNNPGDISPTVEKWINHLPLDPNITQATLNALVATGSQYPAGLTAAPAPGIGALLEAQGWNGATSAASGSPKYPTFALSATTTDGLVTGVITDNLPGSASGVQSAITLGAASVVPVCTYGGPVLVLIDATSAIGNVLIQSTSNAGCATPTAVGSAVVAKTIGVCVSATTISSGLGLCFAYIFHA